MKLRRRAVLKWTGAGLCALIFAAWLGGRWVHAWVVHVGDQGGGVASLTAGQARVVWWSSHRSSRHEPPPGWQLHVELQNMQWDWSVQRNVERDTYGGSIPLYIPFVFLVFPTAWLFYRDRRSVRWARAGRCVGCGYNLSGLPPGAACPECGKGGPV